MAKIFIDLYASLYYASTTIMVRNLMRNLIEEKCRIRKFSSTHTFFTTRWKMQRVHGEGAKFIGELFSISPFLFIMVYHDFIKNINDE